MLWKQFGCWKVSKFPVLSSKSHLQRLDQTQDRCSSLTVIMVPLQLRCGIYIYISCGIYIYMCVFIPHLLYPFICRLALRMFLSMFKQHFFKILALLDLHCCTGFSLVVSGGSSLVAVHWLLIVLSSLVVEHGLQHAGFSRYSIWVQ